jgi:hypothetical protein
VAMDYRKSFRKKRKMGESINREENDKIRKI